MNHGIPDVQAGFRKGRGTRDQVANICWIIDNTRDFQKTSTSVLLTKSTSLCGLQQTVKNSQMGYQTMWPASWEICMQVRKQQLEADMEQQTGSK